MIVQSYSIHGIDLRLAAATPVLAELAGVYLRPFRVEAVDGAAYRLELAMGALPKPAATEGLPQVGQTTLPGGASVRWFASASQRITELGDLGWVQLDFAARTGRIRLAPGAEWALEPGCLMPLLCDLLGRARQHVFHAATLAVATAKGPQAIVLAAVSGAGKTTTSLALSRQGLRLLTDDASFLVERQAGWRLWGYPRPCKVHRQTRAMLDWIAALEPDPVWRQDEFTLDVTRLGSYDPALEVAPGLLVLLEPRNAQAHRIRALDKVQALTELTRQNVRTVKGFAVETAGRSFAALGQLVAQSRTLALSVGPDLGSLGALLRAQLEG